MDAAASDALLVPLRAALAARQDVLDAYLFGSTARGEAREHSDIDIAVFVEPAALERPGFGVAAELAAELGAVLGRNDVDLVVLNGAPPVLYHRVLRDGVRLVARDLRATARREGEALSRYCDFVPQLRKIEQAHRARMAQGNFGK
jgi:predicted nucleotidyltransferase